MYFKHKFFIVVLLISFLFPNFADALIFQSSDVAMRNGMYETGYQERKAKEKAQREAQEAERANQINFDEPDYSSPVENNQLGGPTGPVIAVPSDNSNSKDYNAEIANHLFGNQGTDTKDESKELYIIYFDTSSKSIVLTPGRLVEVHFFAPKGVLWNFEKSSKIFEFKNQRQEKDIFILTYQAVKAGNEKLYFDAMEYNNDQVNVLESKVLNIKVR